jgi:D-lactate dehydrogenase
MIKVACFDTKPMIQMGLIVGGKDLIDWRFLETKLTADTAILAKDSQAVCLFVTDQANQRVLEIFHELGIKLVVLQSAGFNNIDLEAAK